MDEGNALKSIFLPSMMEKKNIFCYSDGIDYDIFPFSELVTVL